MKKRSISLFLSIIMVLSLVCSTSFAASADLSAYALDGYDNKQINNNWAEVTLSDETDANGIITTTATYSGELAAGKRIASFQPWADRQTVSSGDANTMHFGFTVSEITSPVYLEYNYSRDGGAKKTLISFSDSKVAWGGDINGATFVEVTAPYTINIFMNTATCEGCVYVNDKLLNSGLLRNSGSDKKWREVRVFSLETSNNIKLVTTAANSSVYNNGVSFEDVVDAYMGKDEPEVDEPEVEIKDETGNIFYSGVKYMSDYALSGYDNKQINNNWANVTLSDSTDENGVITTTATYSGELEAGKRVASFQPWEKSKPTYTAASQPYTMHFGFTVNEINSPLCLSFKYDGGGDKKLISFSDNKVVWGSSMGGSTFVEVTAPYTINMFMNVQSCRGVIYVNDEVLYDGTLAGASRFYNSSSDKKWHEVRVVSLEKSNDIKLVTTKATTSIFNEQVIFEDVVDYIMNKNEAAKTSWLWQIDGFNAGHESMHGAIDGVSSVTGNNTDGYVLQPNSINESHYGFARFFLSTEAGTALAKSDDDKVLWQSFEYNPTVLTSGQLFEIRGNNAYQTLIKAVPATETEDAYLSIGGNKVEISSDKFYKIDFIVNNKDYEYYILVDGKIVNHDTVWDTRQPLWNTVFSSYTKEEKMTLKNVKTTLYDNTVSVLDIVKEIATSVYADISDVVYDEEYKELVVTATLAGDASAFEEASLVYAAYNADGKLVTVDWAEAYSEDVNTTEFGRAYPYGILDVSGAAEGEKLTIKAFLWENVNGMKAISNAGVLSYTLPTTVVE